MTPLCGLSVAPRAKRSMELAQEEADALGSSVVDTEHLLLGLIRYGLEPFRNRPNRRNRTIAAMRGLPPDATSGARTLLEGLGVDLEVLRRDAVLGELRRAS